MAVKIACDSTADLSKEYYAEHNIPVVPYTIVLGETSYLDGVTISVPEIFDYVEKYKVLPKTAATNETIFEDFFQKHQSKDGLIFFVLSSNMTSNYQNAYLASKNFEKVHVVDTMTLSSGVGMLVKYATELSEQGLSFEEIVEKVENRKKAVQASFIIDRLDYLHKGGRCSTIQFLGANLLRLHPSIVVKDGKMITDKKYRGKMKDIVIKYMDDILETYNTPDLDFCFITCSPLTDQEIVDNAVEHAKSFGFKNVYQTFASSTISSHCGKNTIGILYFNDGK